MMTAPIRGFRPERPHKGTRLYIYLRADGQRLVSTIVRPPNYVK
jgi:hypothetical protein